MLDPFWQRSLDALVPPAKVAPWATPHEMALALDPDWKDAAHIRLIAQVCADAIEGRLPADSNGEPMRKVIIEMPPRHGKSQTAVRQLSAWALARDPKSKIIISTYSVDLARDHSKWVRAWVREHGGEYGLALSADSTAAEHWEVQAGGAVKAAGAGGPITGFGANLLIIDDPIKNQQDADSATMRQGNYDWYRSTASTRGEGKYVTILIHTRWHEDDLIGRMLQEEPEDWFRLRLPALAEVDDPLGREVGEPLWPAAGYDANFFRTQMLIPRWWNAMYQQRPSALEGSQFKRSGFHRFAEEKLSDGDVLYTFDGVDGPSSSKLSDCQVFATMDVALSTRTSADFTVVAVWAHDRSLRPSRAFLVDLVRKRLEGPEQVSVLQTLVAKWPSLSTILVEQNGVGLGVLQLARRAGLPVRGVKADRDKHSRAELAAALMEGRRMFIPRSALWLAEWEDEHLSFPNAAHDDQVDTTAYAAAEVLRWTGSGSGSDRGTAGHRRKSRKRDRSAVAQVGW